VIDHPLVIVAVEVARSLIAGQRTAQNRRGVMPYGMRSTTLPLRVA
jgi:hypothetical protein